MNQKRKRLGLWILFLAALLLTQFTVPVKASEPQIQDVNIQMVGGQIRTIDPMGLRMVACIKKSYIQELEKSGATVSYGIVLLPKKYLTEGQALTLDGKYLYNGSVYKPAKVPAVKKFSMRGFTLQPFWQICRKKDIKMITRRELMQKSREL